MPQSPLAGWSLPGFDLDSFIAATLAEDLGPDGRDVTSEAVIPADALFDGVMDTRDAVTLAGLPLAAAFFRALDPQVELEFLAADGDRVPAGTDIMRIRGRARAMLTAERSALNTVQHLTGIACSGPFDADTVYDEAREAAPFAGLSRVDFDAVIAFVATGGYALRTYERYARIRLNREGRWRVSNPQVAVLLNRSS